MALVTDATVAHAPDAHAAIFAADLAQRPGAVWVVAHERPGSVHVDEVLGRRLEHDHGVEREVEHVALEEELAAGAQLVVQHRHQLFVHQPPLLMTPLEPWIGKVDEHPAQRAIGKQRRQIDVDVAEDGAQVGHALGGGELVDLLDQRRADLEADEVDVGVLRRPLEQEAGVGAADLGLDVDPGGQLQHRQLPREVRRTEGVYVMTNANATTSHSARLPYSGHISDTDRAVNRGAPVLCCRPMPRRPAAVPKRVAPARSGKRSAALRDERRAQLVTAARDVFGQKGYHAATVDDITRAAGVAKGTFYLYFDEKREIYYEVIRGFLALIKDIGASVAREVHTAPDFFARC